MKAIPRLCKIGAIAIGVEIALLAAMVWQTGPCGPGTPIGIFALETQLPFSKAVALLFSSDAEENIADWSGVLIPIFATLTWAITISFADFVVKRIRSRVRKFE